MPSAEMYCEYNAQFLYYIQNKTKKQISEKMFSLIYYRVHRHRHSFQNYET